MIVYVKKKPIYYNKLTNTGIEEIMDAFEGRIQQLTHTYSVPLLSHYELRCELRRHIMKAMKYYSSRKGMVSTFIFTALKRKIGTMIRSSYTQKRTPHQDYCVKNIFEPHFENDRLFDQCKAILTSEEYRLIELRYKQGLSLSEIAKIDPRFKGSYQKHCGKKYRHPANKTHTMENVRRILKKILLKLKGRIDAY